MKIFLKIIIVMASAFTLAGFCEYNIASADTIYLKSGDRLEGEIVQQKDNVDTVKRLDGSPVVLNVSEIQAVESLQPVREESVSDFEAFQDHYGIQYDLTPLAPKFEPSDLINAVSSLNIEIDPDIEGVIVLNTVEKDVARIVRTAVDKKNEVIAEDSKCVLFISPDLARTPDQIIRILRKEKRKTQQQVEKERIAMIQRGEVAKVFDAKEESTKAQDKIASGIVKSSNNFIQFINDLLDGKFRKQNKIDIEDYYLPFSQLFLQKNKQQERLDAQNGEIPAAGPYVQRKYYSSGVLAAEYVYQDGMLSGTSKEYNELGDLKAELNYLNNELNGRSVIYYDSGKILKEISYVNGKEEGDYKEFYESGKLHIEMKLKDGHREDLFKEYFENGNLKYVESYANGKVNGKVQEFNEDGTLKYGAVFNNGVQLDSEKQ